MKITHFWKIHQETRYFVENLPFSGNISMEIGALGLFPCINRDIDLNFNIYTKNEFFF
jgi:hypothetical protein